MDFALTAISPVQIDSGQTGFVPCGIGPGSIPNRAASTRAKRSAAQRQILVGNQLEVGHGRVDVADDNPPVEAMLLEHLFRPFDDPCRLLPVLSQPDLKRDIGPLHFQLFEEDNR